MRLCIYLFVIKASNTYHISILYKSSKYKCLNYVNTISVYFGYNIEIYKSHTRYSMHIIIWNFLSLRGILMYINLLSLYTKLIITRNLNLLMKNLASSKLLISLTAIKCNVKTNVRICIQFSFKHHSSKRSFT